MTRFPDRLPADVEVREADLDREEVHVRGERLTEARAEALAEEILASVHDDQAPSGREE